MSVSDIEEELRSIYEINLSGSSISIITNKVIQAAQEWQNRPLERQYLIVWMDGIILKSRDGGKVINKTVYICVGLPKTGKKEVLELWVGKSERFYRYHPQRIPESRYPDMRSTPDLQQLPVCYIQRPEGIYG